MYLKINGDNVKYNVTVCTMITQHGNKALKIVGADIPTTSAGFKYYSDDDKEILDLSDYTYVYQPNVYTTIAEVIEVPGANNDPVGTSDIDVLNGRVSALASQVSEITPYTAEKLKYLEDTETVFENVPDYGILYAYMEDSDGNSVPCTAVRVNGNVIVSYEAFDKTATVSIIIQ